MSTELVLWAAFVFGVPPASLVVSSLLKRLPPSSADTCADGRPALPDVHPEDFEAELKRLLTLRLPRSRYHRLFFAILIPLFLGACALFVRWTPPIVEPWFNLALALPALFVLASWPAVAGALAVEYWLHRRKQRSPPS